MAGMRFPAIAGAAAVVLALTLTAPPLAGAAITAPGGGAVDNTSWTSTEAQLAERSGLHRRGPGRGLQAAGRTGLTGRRRPRGARRPGRQRRPGG